MPETAKIGDRIKVLKEKLELSSNRALEKAGFPGDEYLISNGLLARWEDKGVDWVSSDLDKFLNHYKVNRDWWKTGEGDVFITPVAKSTDNKEMNTPDKESVYRNLVESNSEYSIVPKTILNGDYRIMLQSEIEERTKMLWQVIEAKNYAIAQLEKEIAGLRSGQIAITTPAPVSVNTQNAQ